MFIWMKLNGIEDTQSLIEEKARDANGNSHPIFTQFSPIFHPNFTPFSPQISPNNSHPMVQQQCKVLSYYKIGGTIFSDNKIKLASVAFVAVLAARILNFLDWLRNDRRL